MRVYLIFSCKECMQPYEAQLYHSIIYFTFFLKLKTVNWHSISWIVNQSHLPWTTVTVTTTLISVTTWLIFCANIVTARWLHGRVWANPEDRVKHRSIFCIFLFPTFILSTVFTNRTWHSRCLAETKAELWKTFFFFFTKHCSSHSQ